MTTPHTHTSFPLDRFSSLAAVERWAVDTIMTHPFESLTAPGVLSHARALYTAGVRVRVRLEVDGTAGYLFITFSAINCARESVLPPTGVLAFRSIVDCFA